MSQDGFHPCKLYKIILGLNTQWVEDTSRLKYTLAMRLILDFFFACFV
jgi:hypothetical protein